MLKLEEELQKIIFDFLSQKGLREKPVVEIETPRALDYGDLSSNIALKVSRYLNTNPLELGTELSEYLKRKLQNVFEKIEIVSPGFINFHLSWDFLYHKLEEILLQNSNYGKCEVGKRQRVLLEFVSANPTGPLSIAHGRQAAIGGSLARILQFAGYRVEKEYYINDEGTQIDLLGESLRIRCLQIQGENVQLPPEGYQGEYLISVARELLQREKLSIDRIKGLEGRYFSQYAVETILQEIKEELAGFGIHYEHWSSQRKLREKGKIEKALTELQKRNLIYEKDGALWFKSTEFGDDQDRVVKRKDGTYTYFAADIAYHKEKFERGYDLLIDIWGPDHHGYISRVKAAMKAMGYSEEQLKILIVQLATVYRDGKPIALSTRKGQLLTLKEVVNEIGRDATLYFLLTRKLDSHLDFDIELAKKQSLENPVYYIQYAHARICSIMEYARENDIHFVEFDSGIFRLLNENEEKVILRLLAQFPRVIKISSLILEPSLLTVYLHNLAGEFHRYYSKHRVVGEKQNLTFARLALIRAIQIVIKNGLGLLGISAPQKM
ncbi:MAG: arginine--tRNA ligase [Candidatus Omnitrophica bacterium 4484_49]|nr:MAG: arginine--tRNA ligase [Candidatus Omnitrophica bacterium 4484_49]